MHLVDISAPGMEDQRDFMRGRGTCSPHRSIISRSIAGTMKTSMWPMKTMNLKNFLESREKLRSLSLPLKSLNLLLKILHQPPKLKLLPLTLKLPPLMLKLLQLKPKLLPLKPKHLLLNLKFLILNLKKSLKSPEKHNKKLQCLTFSKVYIYTDRQFLKLSF